MSHYIVMPIRPTGTMNGDNSMSITDKVARECGRRYWMDKGQANEDAKALAKKYPQVQFAVFEPVRIYETLPPAEPVLIQKRITENGEIVVDKGD